jgi:hypothetical protein
VLFLQRPSGPLANPSKAAAKTAFERDHGLQALPFLLLELSGS